DDAGDDVADNHLEKCDVAPIRHGGHADDCQGARFGCHDGQSDAPPGNVFAAEEVIARVALILAEPDSEGDDAKEIGENDEPIARAKMTANGGQSASFVRHRARQSERKEGFKNKRKVCVAGFEAPDRYCPQFTYSAAGGDCE